MKPRPSPASRPAAFLPLLVRACRMLPIPVLLAAATVALLSFAVQLERVRGTTEQEEAEVPNRQGAPQEPTAVPDRGRGDTSAFCLYHGFARRGETDDG